MKRLKWNYWTYQKINPNTLKITFGSWRGNIEMYWKQGYYPQCSCLFSILPLAVCPHVYLIAHYSERGFFDEIWKNN